MIRRRSAPHTKRVGIIQTRYFRDNDRVIERELIQCCHCQFTKVFTVGDEKNWGLCFKCNDWHCSKPSCVKTCVPIKRWLENRRLLRPDDHVPIVVSVPGVIGGATDD